MAEATHDNTALLFVGCYTKFDDLAHAPRGTPSDASIYTYSLDKSSGKLKHVRSLSGIHNPAFMRFHPTRAVMYAATESIDSAGDIETLAVDLRTGALTRCGTQSAHGASTCYLTLSPELNCLLFTNYWDGSLGAMAVDVNGALSPVVSLLEPPVPVRAASRKDHLQNRQSESHAHAIVLDPEFGRVAFVPDLGMDLIRQYVFDLSACSLTPAGTLPCAPADSAPHGPRYIEFDKSKKTAYVVNELSSSVSVFRFDAAVAADLIHSGSEEPALQLLQVISTLPSPAPAVFNTCGRIAVDPSGAFVLVSNRGHDSIATFAINRPGGQPTLEQVAVTPTHGATPRHFQFIGDFVVVANQDSDSLTVFHLDKATGALTYTGVSAACPSPSFVCVPPAATSAPVPPSTSLEF